MNDISRCINEVIAKCDVCSDCGKYVYSEEYANFILKYDYELESAIEKLKPDCIRVLTNEYAIAYKKIDSRLSMGRYGYNSFPKCYGLMDSTSTNATNVNRIRRVPGLGMTGFGTLFGIIDTGIDYENKVFRNADGSTRILAIWDQSIPSEDMNNEKNANEENESDKDTDYYYKYGTVYKRMDINRALQSDEPKSVVSSTDENGHGTFLASIAAGGFDEKNDFTGMAPGTEIVAVKLKEAKKNIRNFYGINSKAVCYQEDDIMSGIRFLISVAVKERKPMTILIGVGTSEGDHNGNSYLEQYIDKLSDFSGIVFADAAGNELISGGHYLSRVNYRGENTTEEVEISVGKGEGDFTIEIWGQSPGLISLGIESPTGQVKNNIAGNSTANPDGVEISFIYENTKIIVENILLEESTGDQVIIMRFRNPQDGIWKLEIERDPEIVSEYNIWLPINSFLSSDTRFLNPDSNITLCSPANGELSITASGYNHINDAMYVNSSRGYTRSGRRKPDVAAPAVNVFGAWKNDLFTTLSGTSVGAAHLAGSILLILEWGIVKKNYDQINAKIIKQLIIRGARRNPDDLYPNRSTGWGYLDVAGVFEALRK